MSYILKPDEETVKIFSDKTRRKIMELLSEKELTNSLKEIIEFGVTRLKEKKILS